MKFAAGWNVPTYLPEMDPELCESFEEAKQFILGALLAMECDATTDDDATKFRHTAELVNLESQPFTTDTMPDGYVYWIEEAD